MPNPNQIERKEPRDRQHCCVLSSLGRIFEFERRKSCENDKLRRGGVVEKYIEERRRRGKVGRVAHLKLVTYRFIDFGCESTVANEENHHWPLSTSLPALNPLRRKRFFPLLLFFRPFFFSSGSGSVFFPPSISLSSECVCVYLPMMFLVEMMALIENEGNDSLHFRDLHCFNYDNECSGLVPFKPC